MRQNVLSVKNCSVLVQNEAAHGSGVFIGETQKLADVNKIFVAIRKELVKHERLFKTLWHHP